MRTATIRALTHLIQSESGNAMIVVLGFMALTIPVVTGALAFSATASNTARVAGANTASSFTASAAAEYAVYKLVHTAGFKETLVGGVPYNEILPINGEDAIISWTKRAIPGATTPPEAPTVLATTKIVDTAVVPANTPTAVTYTIEVTNTGLAPVTVDEIRDGLPAHFEYVDGTTTGATTANPVARFWDSEYGGALFHQLVWTIGIELAPLASLSISFTAEVDAPDGYYCNLAWANPGGQDTGTGPTAKIQVGTPAMSLCENEAIEVRKTVTPETAAGGTLTTFRYRIEIENLSGIDQPYTWIMDEIPPGFTYVNGSVVSDITSYNPITWLFGPEKLFWWFFFPKQLGAGETRYLEFDATASVAAGDYESAVWVSFSLFGDFAFSGPTARIAVYDVYDIAIANGQTTSTAQVWIGADGDYTVTEWEQNQP